MSRIAISNVLEPIQALQYFLQAPRCFEHGRSLQESHQILLVFYWSQWVSQEKSYSLCSWNQTYIFLSRVILSHSLLSFFSPKQSPFDTQMLLEPKGKERTLGYCSCCNCRLTWYLKKILLKNKPTLQCFEWEEENSKGKKAKETPCCWSLGQCQGSTAWSWYVGSNPQLLQVSISHWSWRSATMRVRLRWRLSHLTFVV